MNDPTPLSHKLYRQQEHPSLVDWMATILAARIDGHRVESHDQPHRVLGFNNHDTEVWHTITLHVAKLGLIGTNPSLMKSMSTPEGRKKLVEG